MADSAVVFVDVSVRVFGALRDHFAAPPELALAEGSRVREALEKLRELEPGAGPVLALCVFAVNGAFASEEQKLEAGDVLEVMPPFSGG